MKRENEQPNSTYDGFDQVAIIHRLIKFLKTLGVIKILYTTCIRVGMC